VKRTSLIQLVPGLPPRIDGIGDYALELARRLRQNYNINTAFIVGDPDWIGGEIDGFCVTKVSQRNPAELLAAVDRCEQDLQSEAVPLLVQFAPYGYQKRGYPLWLQHALAHYAKLKPNLLNFAHHELEVHCRRPWSSAFWVSPFQKNLIKHLVKLGNFQYTNAEESRYKLERWGSGRISLLPNFSTIGEPAANPEYSRRQKHIIVFGRGAQRQWTYLRGREMLQAACKLVGAEKIVDIGPPIPGDNTSAVGDVPILRCGRLEGEEVSQWMGSSLATFTYYPIPLLTKSSIHAVSCAHGTIPFIFDDQTLELSCPGLINGEDYIALRSDRQKVALPPLNELSEKVFTNYQTRNSLMAATCIAKSLFASDANHDI
jgi:hypothetical protein